MLCKFCHKETSSKDGYHPRCKLKALAGGAKPARLTKATPGVVARAPKLKKPTAPTKLCKFCHKGTSSKDGYHPRCKLKALAGGAKPARLIRATPGFVARAPKPKKPKAPPKLCKFCHEGTSSKDGYHPRCKLKALAGGAKPSPRSSVPKTSKPKKQASPFAPEAPRKRRARPKQSVLLYKSTIITTTPERRAVTTVWVVYMLVNHTLREIYFGVTTNLEKRIVEHCKRYTVAISHWLCKVHKIDTHKRGWHADQSAASAAAHLLERTHEDPRGYTVIRTAGI